VEASDDMPSRDYLRQVGPVRPLQAAAARLGASDAATVAAAVEFVLEGLHLSKKLNKDVRPGQHARYRS
jgi:magnesium chelatase subunit I